MRKGVRIGLDPGTVRIGVAVCDPDGVLASPRAAVDVGPSSTEDLRTLVREMDPIEVVVGLPTSLSGEEGAAAHRVREWATRLAGQIDVDVRLVDERLSTVQAQRAYRDQGRTTRDTRGQIDSSSAAIVLQFVLDSERTQGEAPGEVL